MAELRRTDSPAPQAWRAKAASGAVTNVLFSGAGGAVTLVQLVLLPRMLGPDVIGLFALATGLGVTVEALADLGVGDKLVQDRTEDLEKSYQVAFTLALILSAALCVLLLAVSPLVARYYRTPVLWPLLSFMSYRAFAVVLRFPLNLHYRRLDFATYRLYPLLSKCCSLAASLVLVKLGLGVWALAFGELAGLLLSSVPLWMRSPMRARLRYESDTARAYLRFSWPLWSAKLAGALVAPVSVLVVSVYLSITALGHYRFAEQLAAFGLSMDVILAQTAFPILCRLHGSDSDFKSVFVGISRVTMLWAAPVGLGMFVFAPDFLRIFMTPEWAGAEWLIRVQGLSVLIGSLAYSWDVLVKAKDATRPVLTMAVALSAACLLIFLPCVRWFGLPGALAGLGAMILAGTAVKQYYLSRLLPGVSLLNLAPKEVGCALAMSALVMGWRQLTGSPGIAGLLAQAAVFVFGFLFLAAFFERRTLRAWRAAMIRRQTVAPEASDRP